MGCVSVVRPESPRRRAHDPGCRASCAPGEDRQDVYLRRDAAAHSAAARTRSERGPATGARCVDGCDLARCISDRLDENPRLTLVRMALVGLLAAGCGSAASPAREPRRPPPQAPVPVPNQGEQPAAKPPAEPPVTLEANAPETSAPETKPPHPGGPTRKPPRPMQPRLPACGVTLCDDQGNCTAPSPPHCIE